MVEGFFDAMRLYQAGYERVVAIMGSSLSPKQEAMLSDLCGTPDGRLILLFADGKQPEYLSLEELQDILPFTEGGEE